jgi:hypothetical protein
MTIYLPFGADNLVNGVPVGFTSCFFVVFNLFLLPQNYWADIAAKLSIG